MFKTASRYGAIGGAAAIVLIIVGVVFEADQVFGYLTFAALLGTIIWAQIAHKNTGDPPINYGEALGVGIIAAIVFGLVATLYQIIHWTLIDPGMEERMIAIAEDAVRQMGLSEAETQQALEMQKLFIGPIISPIFGMLGYLFGGVALSLIPAAFTRRQAD